MSDAIFLKTAYELSDAIRAKEMSAREVAQAHLDHIAAVDGDVRAYTDVWTENALVQADAIDARIAQGEDPGPFAGARVELTLPPRSKLVRVAQSLFADVGYPLDTSYIRVTSPQKALCGFELFGTLDSETNGLGEQLAGIAAIPY